MMPMPAETLRQSTAQISQNCGGLVGVLEVDVAGRDHRLGVGGRRPARWLPARRRQPIAERAAHHEHEIDHAHGHEGLPDADDRSGVAKCSIRMVASGLPIMAPPPNPMIAMPVAMPRRSGNHLIRVETGEM